MRKWLRIQCSVAIVIFFLLSSCELFKPHIFIDFDYGLFSAEQNAWNEYKPDNYQYNFFRNNPGFEPEMDALIIVENGLFKEQVPNKGENWGDILLSVSPDYQTIDKIYESIEYVYKINKSKTADESILLTKIQIEYDSENHIPMKTEFFFHVEAGVTDVGDYMVYKIDNYTID